MAVAIPLDVFDVMPGAAPAVVTPPLGGGGVPATVQWFQEDSRPAEQAVGAGAASALNRRVIAYVRRDQVANLTAGYTLSGGPAQNQKLYRVHAVDTSDPDYFIAVCL